MTGEQQPASPPGTLGVAMAPPVQPNAMKGPVPHDNNKSTNAKKGNQDGSRLNLLVERDEFHARKDLA
jgi:hypothetical protein